MGVFDSIGSFAKTIGGGLIGGLPGAVLGLGSSAVNHFLGQESADNANEAAQAASAEAYKRYQSRYQDTTADMRAAGLNPIMAASGGFNVGNSVSAAQVHQGSNGNIDLASSAQSLNQANKTTEEIEDVRKSVQLKLNQSVTEMEKALKMRLEAQAATHLEKTAIKTIDNLVQQHKKMAREMSLLVDQADYTKELQESEKYKRQQLKLVSRKLIAELNQIKNLADVYAGPAGKALSYIQEILKTLNMSPISVSPISIKGGKK